MFNYEISDEDYHALPAIGSTDLKRALQSLAHLKAGREHKFVQTASMKFGSDCHKIILEPNTKVTIAPDINKNTTAYKTWKEEHKNQFTIDADDYKRIIAIRESLMRNTQARELIETATHKEIACITGDLKAKFDLYGDGFIADLKTTSASHPDKFKWDFLKYGYDVQAAHYLDVANKREEGGRKFYFIAVETEAPYQVVVYDTSWATISAARTKIDAILPEIRQALLDDVYPSFGTNEVFQL